MAQVKITLGIFKYVYIAIAILLMIVITNVKIM